MVSRDEEEEEALDALASASPDEARAALRRLVSVTTATLERRAQLEQALTSRIAIEQAKGILAGRHDLQVEEAFGYLRNAARRNQRKLQELAREVVDSPSTPREVAELLPGTHTRGRA